MHGRSIAYLAVFASGMLVGGLFGNRIADGPHRNEGVEASRPEATTKAAAGPGRQTRFEAAGNGTGSSDEFDLMEGRAMIGVDYAGHDAFWAELVATDQTADAALGEVAFAG